MPGHGGTIRGWLAGDRPIVRPLIQAYLMHAWGLGGDLIVDDHNVDAVTDLGFSWSGLGEPTLLMTDPVGKIMGCTVWGPVASPLHYRDRVCHAIATFVQPAYRKKRVATELYRTAAEVARGRGYQRIDSVALDTPGQKALEAVGFLPIGGLILRLPLKALAKVA